MAYVNPLCARVTTDRTGPVLHSATVTLDHGLPNQTRVYHRFGYLSETEARRGGIAVATALGRAVVASVLALGIVANVAAICVTGNHGADAGAAVAMFAAPGSAARRRWRDGNGKGGSNRRAERRAARAAKSAWLDSAAS